MKQLKSYQKDSILRSARSGLLLLCVLLFVGCSGAREIRVVEQIDPELAKPPELPDCSIKENKDLHECAISLETRLCEAIWLLYNIGANYGKNYSYYPDPRCYCRDD